MDHLHSQETVAHQARQRQDPAGGSDEQGPVLGAYRLLCRLGEGGMGTVYKARHLRLKRMAALKLLPESRLGDDVALARFRREMEAIGKFDHPHIVRAFDAGEVGHRPFLAMEYVEGLDLHRLVKTAGPLPIPVACELMRQAALGLQYIHEQKLVHRDIKPSNLLLGLTGQVKVLDLGLARLHRQFTTLQGADERLTDTGLVMGTPDYMAPEQALDSHHVDIRADIYSLGCSLYHLLAGKPPFSDPEHQSRMRKIMAHAQEPVPPLSGHRPDVSAALLEVLDRLLEKSPEDRPSTPTEVIELLTPFAGPDGLAELATRAMSEVPTLALQPNDFQLGDPSPDASAAPRPPAASPSTRSRLAPRLGWPYQLLGIGLFSSVLAVILFLALWPASPVPRPEAPALPEPLPGEVFNVLQRPPRKVFWDSRNEPFVFEPGKKLDLKNWDDSLLAFCSTPPRQGYQVRLRIHQTPEWVGGVGLYFGYRPDHRFGLDGHTYQAIFIEPVRLGNPGELVFKRVRYFLPDGQLGAAGVKAEFLGTEKLPFPLAREAVLRIVVAGYGALTEAEWDGTHDLRSLTSTKTNDRFRGEDYFGEIGILSNQTNTTIRDFELLLFE